MGRAKYYNGTAWVPISPSATEYDAHVSDYTKHPGAGTTTNSGNAYSVTLSPAAASYVDKMGLVLTVNADSSAAATINVNGLGARSIVKANGSPVTNLKANGVYTLRYNSTTGNFILQGEGGGTATAADILLGKTASTDAGDVVGTNDSAKRIANLTAIADIYDRVVGAQDVYYDLFDDSNNRSAGLLDTTTSKTSVALTSGTSDLSSKLGVTTGPGFAAGQEITIFDDVNLERKFIQSVGSGGTPVAITSPVSIAGTSAYSATHNFGQRLIRLTSGWLIAAEANSTTLTVLVSKDNGSSWTRLFYVPSTSNANNYGLATNGTLAWLIRYDYNGSNTRVATIAFNPTTVTDTDQTSASVILETTMSIPGSMGISIVYSEGVLHAVWAGSVSPYGSSYNIRYSKSSDNGVTWDAPIFLTTDNVSTTVNVIPTLSVNALNQIVLAWASRNASSASISVRILNGGTWGSVITVFTIGNTNYGQSYPSLAIAPSGRLWCAWSSRDATDTLMFNMRASYSDDNGATWATSSKITTGNVYDQICMAITVDKNNNPFIVFTGIDSAVSTSYTQLRKVAWNGSAWGTVTNLTTLTSVGGVPAAIVLQDNTITVTDPVVMYYDTNAATLKFRGSWQIPLQNLVLTSALSNSYKVGATICRSNVVEDSVNKLLRFGGWVASQSYNRSSSPVTVTTTSLAFGSNGSRSIVRLSNGWIVAAGENDSVTTQLILYVSKDNGATWSQLCYCTAGSTIYNGSFAISSRGTMIYCVLHQQTSLSFYRFDATTVTNTSQTAISTPDSGQSSSADYCSMIVSPSGIIHIAWCTSNATYASSYNVRYTKSLDDGNTWKKADGTTSGADQVTTLNQSGLHCKWPSIIVNRDEMPTIFYMGNTASLYYIGMAVPSAIGVAIGTMSAGWGNKIVSQSSSSAQVLPSPNAALSNSGRIWVVFRGLDSTDTTAYNIRAKYSDDNGITWVNGGVSGEKITSGNSYQQGMPQVSIDNTGQVSIVWPGTDSAVSTAVQNLRRAVFNGTSWTLTTLTSLTSGGISYVYSLHDNSLVITDALVFYRDGFNNRHSFRGSWGTTVEIPILVNDARYNITPPIATADECVSWLTHEKDAGLTITASLSIVDTAAAESYATMTKTTTSVDATYDEEQFVGSVVTPQEKVTVRYTFTRSGASIDKKTTKILGAIS